MNIDMKICKRYRLAAFFLFFAALLACALTGCSAEDLSAQSEVKTGETVSSDSKWINSTIQGAIDEHTEVALKDDFYTAANRDWLLSNTISESLESIDFTTGIDNILQERTAAIMHGEEMTVPGAIALSEADAAIIQHDRELVRTFSSQAADWEKRNSLGIEPLIPYIEAIQKIETMDEMTSYLLNENGQNFSLSYPITFYVSEPIYARDIYTLAITSDPVLLLEDSTFYSDIDFSLMTGIIRKELGNQRGTYILERLGYSPNEIKDLMRQCYRFEARLAEGKRDEASMDPSDMDNAYTMEALAELAGNYPMMEILAQYRLDGVKSVTVTNPDYVRMVGRLYSETYLAEMKAYYIVHTAIDAMPLLDRAAFEQYVKFLEIIKEKDTAEPNPDGGETPPIPTQEANEEGMTEKEREDHLLLTYFVQPYLGRVIDEIYVSTYCTEKEKSGIMDMISDILAYYSDMLMEEDWLSEETRTHAVQKLDNMAVHAVYPDEFFDHGELTLSNNTNLVQSVAAINTFALNQAALNADQPIDRSKWGNEMSNLTVNAYYNPANNSINILAGILADGSLFREDAKYEENLARLGAIIGHEITHAFDNTGSQYDEYGRKEDWWTPVDKQAFRLKASRLANHFSALSPYPGAISYDGSSLQGEAIADMGGMKCVLGLAAKQPGFDYDTFFRTFADLWKQKSSLNKQIDDATDVHPLHFLRVNVTLQQFESFNETYGIHDGDGMYLAPEKRILVW